MIPRETKLAHIVHSSGLTITSVTLFGCLPVARGLPVALALHPLPRSSPVTLLLVRRLSLVNPRCLKIFAQGLAQTKRVREIFLKRYTTASVATTTTLSEYARLAGARVVGGGGLTGGLSPPQVSASSAIVPLCEDVAWARRTLDPCRR